MRNTDFVDEDLSSQGRREEGSRIDPAGNSLFPGKLAPGENAERLTQHKEAVSSEVCDTISEIERLRQRQQALEQERKDLEELARKQEEYERGKREIIGHLNEGVVALEKKEVHSAQLTELLAATRSRFKEALEEIERINENNWPDATFREELYKALVIVDDARMEYNKALAKIAVLEGGGESLLERGPLPSPRASENQADTRSFGFWVKVGLAVTLPLVLLLGIIGAALVLLYRYG